MMFKTTTFFLFFSTLSILASCQEFDAAGDVSSTSTEPPTTSEACMDAPDSNCADLKDECSNEKFIPLLKQFCPVTCNLCPGATTVAVTKTTLNPNCVDSAQNCKNWAKNGFCTNPFYTCQNRLQNCAKSCGLCYPNPCGPKMTIEQFERILFGPNGN